MFYLNAYLSVREQYELVEILRNWKIIKSSSCTYLVSFSLIPSFISSFLSASFNTCSDVFAVYMCHCFCIVKHVGWCVKIHGYL